MDTIGKLLFNLQTIASISKGKKISTVKEFITVDEGSLLSPIMRWRSGDGRDKAVQAICREVRTIIVISERIIESKHIYHTSNQNNDLCDIAITHKPSNLRDIRVNEIKKIRASLIDANHGIANICETYVDDANVLAYLKPLIGEINDHISAITKLLIEIGEYVETRAYIRV